jgi:hypothetical protein
MMPRLTPSAAGKALVLKAIDDVLQEVVDRNEGLVG